MLINQENANLNLDTDNYYGFSVSSMRHMELNILYFLERYAATYLEKTNIKVTPESEKNNVILKLDKNINFEAIYTEIQNSNLVHKNRLLQFLSMILLSKTKD